MKTIILDPMGINNFHRSQPLTVRVSGEKVSDGGEDLYRISARQADRIEKHFCGIAGCHCPAGGVVVEVHQDGHYCGLRA